MASPPDDPQQNPLQARPKRRFPLIAIGAALALIGGLGVAGLFTMVGGKDKAAPPASEGGLVIDSSGAGEGKIDPGKPLRCFVGGQFVGELSLTECAKRNGVATDALDVGLDPNGALAAADQAGETLTPLPPDEVQPVTPQEPAATPDPVASPDAPACLRRGAGRWIRVAGPDDLNACVQALFAGHCVRPGAADYGRWDQQTLRLVTGRVEISDDNRSFRMLAAQSADCTLPPVG